MKVDDRPNASQEASRDDRKRTEQKATGKGNQVYNPHSKKMQEELQKNQRQVFEKVLREAGTTEAGSQAVKSDQVQEFVVQKVEQRQDREEDRKDSNRKDSDDRKDVTSDKEGSKESGSKLGKHQRVETKKSLGERGSGSGDSKEEKEHSGGKVALLKQNPFKLKKQGTKEDVVPVMVHAELNTSSLARSVSKSQQVPKTLPQELISQIIAMVRVGLSKDLEKEMEIKFKNSFFKGLRLKVVKQGGRLQVFFFTSDGEVARLFESEKHLLRRHLQEKEINVDKIFVECS